ncbi:MAG TPA: hypothetical protein DIC34_06550 [Treponema sp.]|nr:MAG: hypothetical protein A2Y36_18430 [Treponema sp. GWA1_62_8]OHE73046.1 MAG: hypothetical protein A2413_12045 [Treponema sp. RIFOXYC1_FULL_61_9]HCM26192.1 hypothetical protein [Treponema sp.]
MRDEKERSSRLLSLLGQVRRARGFRLYLADGRRLVDLWQDGGHAALGHTPPSVLLAFKNAASRGLFSPFPHPADRAFRKALARLFPDCRSVRIYSGEQSADDALAAASFGLNLGDFPDPAMGPVPADSSAILWRPWCPVDSEYEDEGAPVPLTLPVLPLPAAGRPVVLLLSDEADAALPPSDFVSPVILLAAARAVDDLIAAYGEREALRFRRTDEALAAADCSWTRRGVYLSPTAPVSVRAWEEVFGRFLTAGFLLPPDPRLPVILPGELSGGEDAALARELAVAF